MNIEEAKSNIGKEVVYIGKSVVPYLYNKAFKISNVLGELIQVDMNGVFVLAEPQELQLKQPTYKVGDQVVLDESTKPYTVTERKGRTSEKSVQVKSICVYTVLGIGADGDVHLAEYGWIQPRHLKLAPQLKINGKEIKDFDANEQVLSKTKSLLSEIQVPINVKVDVIVEDKPKYHSQEMRKYRNEVAQLLLENGVTLDKDFKNKIDLYVNAVTTK